MPIAVANVSGKSNIPSPEGGGLGWGGEKQQAAIAGV